jgi:hypothetical protein
MAKAQRPTPKELLTRHDHADKKWLEWRSLQELCYQYAAPQRNLYDGQSEGNTQGRNKMANVFDSTAISSLNRFANRMQSGVFPPQRNFCRLLPGTDIPQAKHAEVSRILGAYTDRMFAVIRSSNFDIAMGEFLTDLGIGTACMCIQPGDAANPVNYICVPPYLVRFDEDEFGRPCNVYRKIKIKPELIERLWKGAELNDDLRNALRDKPHEEVELLECTSKDLESGAWWYQVVTLKGEHEVYKRKQRYSNWVISRYSKLAGELMGRGPVMSALPDIRTLNKVKELILRNAAKAVSGVYTGRDDGVLNPNNVKIIPGAVIGVASNGGPQGPSLQALQSSADFNVAQLVINDLVMSIKKIMLDESLPPDNMSARSATEVVERMKELAQNLGSAFGRLIDEVEIPIVETTLMVLDERGVIEFPLQVNGREVKVIPTAPLANAQFMEEVESVVNFAMIAQQVSPMEGKVALDEGKVIDYIGEKMGIPADLRRTPEERAAKMDEMMKQAAQMAQMVAQAQAPAEQPAGVPA